MTFLIPVFAIGWGAIVLDERVTLPMLAGGAVVLLGTALTLGLLRRRGRARKAWPNPGKSYNSGFFANSCVVAALFLPGFSVGSRRASRKSLLSP